MKRSLATVDTHGDAVDQGPHAPIYIYELSTSFAVGLSDYLLAYVAGGAHRFCSAGDRYRDTRLMCCTLFGRKVTFMMGLAGCVPVAASRIF